MILTKLNIVLIKLCLIISNYSFASELFLQYGYLKISRFNKTLIYSQKKSVVKLKLFDKVQTGSNTLAIINFKKGNEVIKLGSRSFLSYDNSSKEISNVSLYFGKAQFKIKSKELIQNNLNLNKPKNRFNVRTLTAIIGVRGTDFIIGVGDTFTNLITIEGSVYFSSREAPEIEIKVDERQVSQVSKGLLPTEPFIVSNEEKEQIILKDSSDVFKIISFPSALPVENDNIFKNERKMNQNEKTLKEGNDNPSVSEESQLMFEINNLNEINDLEDLIEETFQNIIPEEEKKILNIKINRE